jgi:hypothetical protein
MSSEQYLMSSEQYFMSSEQYTLVTRISLQTTNHVGM